MNKTKIEWCDMTWNPVTGCLHNCEYCYARKISDRFQINDVGKYIDIPFNEWEKYSKGDKIYSRYFQPRFHSARLDEPQKHKKPQNVFVCSMADLFGEWVPDKWIKKVFEETNKAPQHRYIYLTKNPDRYYQLWEGDEAIIPDGGVIGLFGASACTETEAESARRNLNCSWMSLEPLQGDFSEEFFWHNNRYIQDIESRWQWIIIGAETGNRKGKIIPKREWIENIVNACRDANVPVFLKDNLASVWGEPLIQEFPWKEKSNDR